MAHWMYILSAASGSLGFAFWYYVVRVFFLIKGSTTDDEQRSRKWFEAARLMRKDAKDFPSYLIYDPGSSAHPAEHSDPVGPGASTSREAAALEALPDHPARAS